MYSVYIHNYVCTCTYIDAALFSYSETYQVYVHFTLAIHISESGLSDSQTCTYMCAPGHAQNVGEYKCLINIYICKLFHQEKNLPVFLPHPGVSGLGKEGCGRKLDLLLSRPNLEPVVGRL